MGNNVRQIRKALGWSQKKLAELVGTSQQQIQRIESGMTEARVALAVDICEAVGKPIETVFPMAKSTLERIQHEIHSSRLLPSDELLDEACVFGIEADLRLWHFKFLLRGHREPILIRISARDKRRLFSLVQSEISDLSKAQFLVFDSVDYCVGLALREVIWCQFLFDYSSSEDDRPIEEASEVRVFFCGVNAPTYFGVNADSGSPSDEDDEGEFRHIFFMMELDTEVSDRFHFTDVDGESVFFRIGDIALLQVPLWVIEPEEYSDKSESKRG